MPGSTSTCAAPGRSARAHTAALARLAETHRLARLTRHGELIVQRAAPTVRMGKATVALPPGAFLQATAEGEAMLARLVSEHVGKRQGRGRPVLRRRAVRAAACRARARHRGRCRRGRDRGACARRPRRPASSRSRPRRAICSAARSLPDELKALRRGRVRSAASGRRGAGAPACGVKRAAGRRGVVQCRDLRARRAHSRRRRLPADRR